MTVTVLITSIYNALKQSFIAFLAPSFTMFWTLVDIDKQLLYFLLIIATAGRGSTSHITIIAKLVNDVNMFTLRPVFPFI